MKSMNMAVWLFEHFVPILIVLGILYIVSQFKKMSEFRKEIQKRDRGCHSEIWQYY